MVEIKVVYVVVDDGKCIFDDVIEGVDIFLGCFGLKVLIQEMVKKMVCVLMILVLVNLELEILLLLVKEVCLDVIICIGCFDYLNQVNNVLCFLFIFCGVLDVGVIVINEEMKLVVVCVIVEFVYVEQSEVVVLVYGDQDLSFGLEYIILKLFDLCLIVKIVFVVVKVVMELGVVICLIVDFDVYIDKLIEFVYKINLFMKLIFFQVCKVLKCVVLLEGEEVCVLYVIQELVMLGLVKLIFIGCLNVIEMCIQKLGLQIKVSVDFEIVNNEFDLCFKEYWIEYFQIMKCCGVIQEQVQWVLISNLIVIGVIMVQCGEVDVMICGMVGDYYEYFSVVKNVFGYCDGVYIVGVMNVLLLLSGNIFIVDIYVNDELDVEELVEIILMVVEIVCCFGIELCVVLLLYFNFGFFDCLLLSKMCQVLELVRECVLELMIDGEMYGDVVLVEVICNDCMLDSFLKGFVNILVMLNMEVVCISYNLLCVFSLEGVIVGLVLMGVVKLVYVLMLIVLVCCIVNMVVLVVVEV